MSESKLPKRVLIIRHGEKRGDPSADNTGDGPSLSTKVMSARVRSLRMCWLSSGAPTSSSPRGHRKTAIARLKL